MIILFLLFCAKLGLSASVSSQPARPSQSPPDAAQKSRPGEARFSADGRWIRFATPAVASGQAGWSAVFKAQGREEVISSWSAREVSAAGADEMWKTPLGLVRCSRVIARGEAGVELELILGQLIDAAGFMVQGVLKNQSGAPVEVSAIIPFHTDRAQAELRLIGPARQWQATPAAANGFDPVPLGRLNREAWAIGSLALYRPDGAGFFVGPAARSLGRTHLAVHLDPAQDGTLPLCAGVWLDDAPLRPGEILASEPVLVLMERPFEP